MANNFKEIKTRIALKQNTYEYWLSGAGKDYIPLYGEVCLCEIPAPEENKNPQTNGAQEATNPPTVLFKVGTAQKNADGSWVEGTNKKFSELNWVSALAADVYDWAKQSPDEFLEWLGEQEQLEVIWDTEDRKETKTYTLAGYAEEVIGNPSNLTTTSKNLVGAINEAYQAVNVGGKGSVVTIKELETPTTGSDATYQLYQGVNEDNSPIAVGDKIEIPSHTFKAESNTVTAVGGIAAGTSVNGLTFQELFYNMMFPYQNPALSNVKASPNGGTYMKGNKQTITSVTATVTKKTSKIDKVELYNSSTLVATTTTTSSGGSLENGGTVSFSVEREVSSNGGQYKVKVYDVGGKTAEANTGSFAFVNPYYYGVCAPNAEITDNVVTDLGLIYDFKLPGKPSGKNTINIDYKTDAQRMVIAYPTAYGELKSIKDGNGMENLTAFANKETVQITNSYGYTESYYVYTNGVTSGAATMKFAFAV